MRQPVDHKKAITINPDIRFGKPCIHGTRITVFDVVEHLAGGMTEEEILDEFPHLTLDNILACYNYLADENMVPRRPPGHKSPFDS